MRTTNSCTGLLRIGLMLAALIWVPALSFATLPPVTNFAKVTLSIGYDSTATSLVLVTGQGSKLPSTFPFPLVWWNASDYGSPEDDPFVEVVSVTNRTGDTLTVVRGQEGTSASNHNTGGKTYRLVLSLTKSMWDQIRTDIATAAGASSMVSSGSGSPEGVVTGAIGAIFLRTDTAPNILYQKTSGTGNTGWISQPDLASPGPIGGTTPNSGAFTLATMNTVTPKQIVLTASAPTYGTSVAIDAGTSTWNVITATNGTAFTIQNPGMPPTNTLLIITVKNTSGGTLGAITWDTLYKMASFTSPANGKSRTVTFIFNGTNWIEISCSPEVPN